MTGRHLRTKSKETYINETKVPINITTKQFNDSNKTLEYHGSYQYDQGNRKEMYHLFCLFYCLTLADCGEPYQDGAA